MKNWVAILMAVVISLGMFTGCGSTATDSNTRVITDCSGTDVEIPKNIERIVCTSASAVPFLLGMGVEDKIIGAHGSTLGHSWAAVFYDGFKEEAGKVTLFGKNPNAEELISAEADLVILKDAAYAEELRKAGIPAVCFKYTNKDELYAAVDMLGEIFGSDAKAYAVKWEEKLDSTIETISKDLAELPETEKCNVYYVDATGAEASNENLFLTAGGGSFVEYWINTSGANLVTSPYKDIEQIDQEEGLSLNPDTIFICGWLEYTAKDIMMSDPLWQDVPAVKNDRVFLMPTSLASYDRFSVELPLMLDYTANKMYPDYHEFGGIDELREFYKDYYGREFSDEQLENMLEGLNPDGTRMGE
ncbi:MAG: ABC transporter substrate-binding protein [Oscillospiraceae bacterium]|nr:ABC transporter substrate-binding protein [Oscillospiraceae bacterium]